MLRSARLRLQALGIECVSLSGQLDTSTPTGKMVFTVLIAYFLAVAVALPWLPWKAPYGPIGYGLLAEGHPTRQRLGSMLQRIAALPLPNG